MCAYVCICLPHVCIGLHECVHHACIGLHECVPHVCIDLHACLVLVNSACGTCTIASMCIYTHTDTYKHTCMLCAVSPICYHRCRSFTMHSTCIDHDVNIHIYIYIYIYIHTHTCSFSDLLPQLQELHDALNLPLMRSVPDSLGHGSSRSVMYMYICMCVCVCVCLGHGSSRSVMYMCMCVCVCSVVCDAQQRWPWFIKVSPCGKHSVSHTHISTHACIHTYRTGGSTTASASSTVSVKASSSSMRGSINATPVSSSSSSQRSSARATPYTQPSGVYGVF